MDYYLLIAGSRNFEDEEMFKRIVHGFMIWRSLNPAALAEELKITIVEGGARGVDIMAMNYALENGLELIEVKPDWKKYGRAAGPKRNDEMVKLVKEKGGEALYIWDGESRGTKQCITSAVKAGLNVTVWLTTESRYLQPWEVPT